MDVLVLTAMILCIQAGMTMGNIQPSSITNEPCVCEEWAQWSHCSSDCGPGEQHRQRTCLENSNEGCKIDERKFCESSTCEKEPGNRPSRRTRSSDDAVPECSVCDNWTQWTQCNSTCGAGFKTRRRSCCDNMQKEASVCFKPTCDKGMIAKPVIAMHLSNAYLDCLAKKRFMNGHVQWFGPAEDKIEDIGESSKFKVDLDDGELTVKFVDKEDNGKFICVLFDDVEMKRLVNSSEASIIVKLCDDGSNPCLNKGKCKKGENEQAYHCECTKQYFGKFCERKRNNNSVKVTLIVLSILLAFGALAIIIGVANHFKTREKHEMVPLGKGKGKSSKMKNSRSKKGYQPPHYGHGGGPGHHGYQSGYSTNPSYATKSTFPGGQSSYGGGQSSYGGGQSSYGGGQSSYGGGKSSYGGSKSDFYSQPSSYGTPYRSASSNRVSFTGLTSRSQSQSASTGRSSYRTDRNNHNYNQHKNNSNWYDNAQESYPDGACPQTLSSTLKNLYESAETKLTHTQSSPDYSSLNFTDVNENLNNYSSAPTTNSSKQIQLHESLHDIQSKINPPKQPEIHETRCHTDHKLSSPNGAQKINEQVKHLSPHNCNCNVGTPSPESVPAEQASTQQCTVPNYSQVQAQLNSRLRPNVNAKKSNNDLNRFARLNAQKQANAKSNSDYAVTEPRITKSGDVDLPESLSGLSDSGQGHMHQGSQNTCGNNAMFPKGQTISKQHGSATDPNSNMLLRMRSIQTSQQKSPIKSDSSQRKYKDNKFKPPYLAAMEQMFGLNSFYEDVFPTAVASDTTQQRINRISVIKKPNVNNNRGEKSLLQGLSGNNGNQTQSEYCFGTSITYDRSRTGQANIRGQQNKSLEEVVSKMRVMKLGPTSGQKQNSESNNGSESRHPRMFPVKDLPQNSPQNSRSYGTRKPNSRIEETKKLDTTKKQDSSADGAKKLESRIDTKKRDPGSTDTKKQNQSKDGTRKLPQSSKVTNKLEAPRKRDLHSHERRKRDSRSEDASKRDTSDFYKRKRDLSIDLKRIRDSNIKGTRKSRSRSRKRRSRSNYSSTSDSSSDSSSSSDDTRRRSSSSDDTIRHRTSSDDTIRRHTSSDDTRRRRSSSSDGTIRRRSYSSDSTRRRRSSSSDDTTDDTRRRESSSYDTMNSSATRMSNSESTQHNTSCNCSMCGDSITESQSGTTDSTVQSTSQSTVGTSSAESADRHSRRLLDKPLRELLSDKEISRFLSYSVKK